MKSRLSMVEACSSADRDARLAAAKAGWTGLQSNGWKWRVHAQLGPEATRLLTSPDWLQIRASSHVELIKDSRRRSVVRVAARGESPALYCKQFVNHGWADWFRSAVRGSPARWEASRIRLAEERGIPTAELLGDGESMAIASSLESRLITRAIDGASTLASWCAPAEIPEVPDQHDAEERSAWLISLADLLAGLHGRGLWHGDLHSGNVLMRRDAEGWRCWLIDLSALRGGEETPLHRIFENLARFWLSIERLITRDERRSLARDYWQRLATWDARLAQRIGRNADEAAEVLLSAAARATVPIHHVADKAWERGSRRVVVTSRGRFLASLGAAWTQDFSEQLLEWWKVSENGPCHEGIESRRSLQTTPFGARMLRLIRFPKHRQTLGWSRARTAWESGHALHRRGVPVAVPWGYVESTDADILVACEPPGSQPPDEQVCRSPLNHKIRELLAMIGEAGFMMDFSTGDAIRVSSDGRWLGWCALESLRRRRWCEAPLDADQLIEPLMRAASRHNP